MGKSILVKKKKKERKGHNKDDYRLDRSLRFGAAVRYHKSVMHCSLNAEP